MLKFEGRSKTIICIGSGGVGKTTISASLAVGLAAQGKKVLVLTIDPSLRLAQALGIKTDGELHRVSLEGLADGSTTGELWSCVIDHKKTFEWFITNASGDPSADNATHSLLNNRLYQQLSGRLSGSQEFTSLISLYRYVSSGRYDHVILDTPPSQHTWNFLRAPEKIAALFNEGVASWFREADENYSPGVFKKILNLGTNQVLKALEMLTGSQFMKELSAFFRAIQKWQGPLESYVNNCHRLLISPETEFLLVTALDSSRLNEAQKLTREIQKQGYRLTHLIVNRIPLWTKNNQAPSERVQELLHYYQSLDNDLQKRLAQFTQRLKVYKCYEMSQNSEDAPSLYKTYKSLTPVL